MVAVFRLPASVQADDNQQGSLALSDFDGARVDPLGMGVLSDGTPFLTQRGLAVLCGVENAHIGTISSQWHDSLPKPRISKIRDILSEMAIAYQKRTSKPALAGVLYTLTEKKYRSPLLNTTRLMLVSSAKKKLAITFAFLHAKASAMRSMKPSVTNPLVI